MTKSRKTENNLPQLCENPDQPALIVGIGASAGGLSAFSEFLSAVPGNNSIAYILLPHLDPQHKSVMKELLTDKTHMQIQEVQDGMKVEPNQVYIIPPGKGATIQDGTLHLEQLESPAYKWTVIDRFLRTLAKDQHERAVGIILSGTGSHGTLGIRDIKQSGGLVLAQMPESSQYSQMPLNAINSGMVDLILPPAEMPAVLMDFIKHPYLGLGSEINEITPELINPILNILRSRTRFDFRDYRKNMLIRRIHRRMGLINIDSLEDYQRYLRDHSEEVKLLCKDLLIGVTAFFRDPESFHVLDQRVIKELVAHNSEGETIRVWVPACSTGEEAYTLGILFLEAFETARKTPSFQIFATDIDEDALVVARQGIYPGSIENDVSEKRLKQFFVKVDEDKYQVTKRLRDNLVFASQSVISDAPFSHLDLVSCRNFLIYLLPEMQAKVIRLFHFSLKEKGYMFLGPSESIGRQSDLFEVLSKKWRLFQRSHSNKRKFLDVPIGTPRHTGYTTTLGDTSPYKAAQFNPGELMLKSLVEDYAPASVLINRSYEILQFFGPTINYLNLPDGAPTQDLMVMLKNGLSSRIRAIAHRVWQEQLKVIDTQARVMRDGHYVPCTITARPVSHPQNSNEFLLLSFEDQTTIESDQSSLLPADQSVEDLKVVEQLEYELKATREDLQSNLEELESSNEELKAANEEMMSMNEELQSANEELETSKEELQSMNEELSTVNAELQSKLEELEASHDDVNNLLASTDIATVFLDLSLCIKLFNPLTAKLLNLRNTDIDRPISDFSGRVDNVHFQDDLQTVLDKLTPIERVVSSLTEENPKTYLRRIVPYRAGQNRIGGVVVTFIDITERYHQEKLLEEKVLDRTAELTAMNEKMSLVLQASGAALWQVKSDGGRCPEWSPGTKRLFGNPPVDLEENWAWWKSCIHPEDRKTVIDSLDQAMAGKTNRWEQSYRFKMQDGVYHWLSDIAYISRDKDGKFNTVTGAMIDINQRKQTEIVLKEREQRLAAIMNSAADALIVINDKGEITDSNPAAERMFLYSNTELIGMQLNALLPSLVSKTAVIDKSAFSNLAGSDIDKISRQIFGLRKDGSNFPLEINATEVDGFGLIVAVIRDLSEQRRLQNEVVTISTREQENTGRELHDGLGQRLTGLLMLASHARNSIDKKDLPDIQLLADIVQQLKEAAEEVKRISHGLAPITISPDGLSDALSIMVQTINVSAKEHCEFKSHASTVILNEAVSNQIYRIAQEAFNNALKYAEAKNITLSLNDVEEGLELSIIDDGKGFDLDELLSWDGFGVRIMHYRACSVGAALHIDTAPGKGTRVRCYYQFPADKNRE